MSDPIATIKNNLEQELTTIQSLRRKYPYLGRESDSVGSEIEQKLRQLGRYSDLSGYSGPSYNLINFDTDDIGVATAKLRAQLDWIDTNQSELYSSYKNDLSDILSNQNDPMMIDADKTNATKSDSINEVDTSLD